MKFEENKFISRTAQDMNGQNNLDRIGIPKEKTVSRMDGRGGPQKTNMFDGESAITAKRMESGEK